jgi:hypothetical protein
MTHRRFLAAVLIVLCVVSLATDAVADIRLSSRMFDSGLDRFATRLIDAASDQESLSSDPGEEVRRAALPIDESDVLRVPDIEREFSTADLGACSVRSPPSA